MAAAVVSSTRSAVAEAATAIAIHPPASPFAELLRRSRFASFDPAIRQTYSTPPAYAHKGDWGLKRPIALRRRNAFINLTSFESPAQFIEWNNAENQVRFIRRIEEMGTMPRTAGNTPWHKSVGKGKTQWFMDSEFCPGEGQLPKNEPVPPITLDLKGLGTKGPKQYSAKRGPPRQSHSEKAHVSPNIDAMSPKEFMRYLRTLRELRPAFQAHLGELAKKNPKLANKSLYELAQSTEAGYHRRFLQENMSQEFAKPESLKFEQHPHPNAALLYHHPSALDTHLTTKPKPGLVLNLSTANVPHTKTTSQGTYVASFGGMAAVIEHSNAGGKRPLLDPNSEEGIDRSRVEESTINMRLKPNGLILQVPPRVVGRQSQGLKAVKIHADVTTDARDVEFGRDNPHPPGSLEYNAADPPLKRSAPSDFSKPMPKRITATAWDQQNKLTTQASGKILLNTLKGIMGQGWGGASGGSEQGL
jgi:hypothetical protein